MYEVEQHLYCIADCSTGSLESIFEQIQTCGSWMTVPSIKSIIDQSCFSLIQFYFCQIGSVSSVWENQWYMWIHGTGDCLSGGCKGGRSRRPLLNHVFSISLADPRGAPGTRAPPWGPKFFHFHALFGKKLKNNSTSGSWRTPWGKSWIRHCCHIRASILTYFLISEYFSYNHLVWSWFVKKIFWVHKYSL